MQRQSTGVPGLDELLGGGLLPGTLTVVAGATGCGKTQLGLQFLHGGLSDEARHGIVFDMTCRGDSQSHLEYAQRMFDWRPTVVDPTHAPSPEQIFDLTQPVGDYLRVFDYQGRRATRDQVDTEAWRQWQGEMVRKLNVSIAFFYANFVRGVRRCVIDGVEPADRATDSIQLELFEYVYHQILRKDADWVARDLLRQDFRGLQQAVEQHRYEHSSIGCLLLYTTHESMLEGLIERRLDEGDLLAGANTIIYLGKIREGNRLRRALYVPKHRGSRCTDEIVPYEIDDHGLRIG